MIKNILHLFFLILLSLLFSCSEVESIPANHPKILSNNLNCYYFFIPDCPACRINFAKVLSLRNQYPSKILKITAVYSDPIPDTLLLNETIRNFNFDLPIIFDSTLILAKKYGVKVTPQFVLLNSSNEILYSGAFDNYFYGLGKHRNKVTQKYLEDAIESALSNKPTKITYTEPFGCKINYTLKN